MRVHLNVKVFAHALVISGLCRNASSHMIMQTPTPFSNSTLQLGPLNPSGSNFPCQYNGDASFYDATGISNAMAVGQAQTLSFRGSAVHGGGSCQIAITTDMAPGQSTAWQVILSIEGGCPSTTGNGPSTYQFTIPEGTKPGNYALAWTWVSKLAGQPEYYMNCAPIQVSAAGKSGQSSALSSGSNSSTTHDKRLQLPNLAVFNMASINQCKTTPGTDVVYADPGPDLLKPSGLPRTFGTPSGTSCFPLSTASRASPSGQSAARSSPISSSKSSTSAASASSPNPSPDSTGASTSKAAVPTLARPPAGAAGASPTGRSTTSDTAISPSSTSSSEDASTSTPCASPSVGDQATTRKAQASGGVSPIPSLSFPLVTPGSGEPTAAQSSPSPASPSLAAASLSSTSNPIGSPTAASTSSTISPASPPSSQSSPASGSAPGGNTPGALSGACTQEGMWNCIGGNTFQRCASGQWTTVMSMASGTYCQPGQSQSLWARARFSRERMLARYQMM